MQAKDNLQKKRSDRKDQIKRLSLSVRTIPLDDRQNVHFIVSAKALHEFEMNSLKNGFTWDEQIRRLMDAVNLGQLEDSAGDEYRKQMSGKGAVKGS